MSGRIQNSRDVALPASVFSSLGHALRSQAGPLAAIHGLHAAGYGAGEALYEGFTQSRGEGEEEAAEAFWRSLSSFLERRGWGSLRHRGTHEAVGLLASSDWAEAEGARSAQPSCAFSVGMLSHLLTRVAGEPIGVLEVGCRASGADECTFAFGSEAAIHDLYGRLLEGTTVESALASL